MRLSETLRSLEHDRELALAGILSRKLVFLKQVGKRERKRKKLVDVKKQMDEILRDADLEQLGTSLNQVWESNRPDAENSSHAEMLKDKSQSQNANSKKSNEEKSAKSSMSPNTSVDGNGKTLKRIEKGVELYLAATNARKLEAAHRSEARRGFRPNRLPSIAITSHHDTPDVKASLHSKLTPMPHDSAPTALPIENDGSDPLADITNGFDSEPSVRLKRNDNGSARTIFETETPEMYAKKVGLPPRRNYSINKASDKGLQKGKGIERKADRPAQGTQLNDSHKIVHPTNSQSDPYSPQPDESVPDTRAKLTSPRVNQCSGVLKPLPPYLLSKPSQRARAPSNLTSPREACLRTSMERTVTMIFVEDSDVEMPKSSFDVDAWLEFMRQKKGYSATLNEGPLEESFEGSSSNDKTADSKRSVKFAFRKKKLRAVKTPDKTCRDRANEWFREFSNSDKNTKKYSGSRKLNPLKSGRSPVRGAVPTDRPGESSRLPREAANQLLQRIREDSKLLQEKVHHLCNDAYWKFWSNGSLDDSAKS